jgi:hypothetical protein
MADLSRLEIQVMHSLLARQFGPQTRFLAQLAVAKATKRQTTGSGYYLDLCTTAEPVDSLNAELSCGYKTGLPAPADLVGFTLFIREGVLSWLEGYMFGDVAWPDIPVDDWVILEPV